MSTNIKDQVNYAPSYYGTFIKNENNEVYPNVLSQTGNTHTDRHRQTHTHTHTHIPSHQEINQNI